MIRVVLFHVPRAVCRNREATVNDHVPVCNMGPLVVRVLVFCLTQLGYRGGRKRAGWCFFRGLSLG